MASKKQRKRKTKEARKFRTERKDLGTERLEFLRAEAGINPDPTDWAAREYLRSVPNLPEVRRAVSKYSARSILRELCAPRFRSTHPFKRARLAREAAIAGGSDSAPSIPGARVPSLMKMAFETVDPEGVTAGGGPVDTVPTRVAAYQLMLERNVSTDCARVFGALRSTANESPISDGAWSELLGVTLQEFFLASIGLAQRLDNEGLITDPRNRETRPTSPPLREGGPVMAVLESLSLPLDGFRQVALEQEEREASPVNQPGPLVRVPIIEFEKGVFGSPSPRYVSLAASPPALYLKLARADGRGRSRTTAVGHQFAEYLEEWAAAELMPSWRVTNLDEILSDKKKHADLLVVSANRQTALLVEAKTTMQVSAALMGDEQATRQLESRVYKEAFEQIDATKDEFARRRELHKTLPPDINVFGLAVTLDLHQHHVIDDTTHIGLPNLSGSTPAGGARGEVVRSRLIQADDFETLLSALAKLDEREYLRYLNSVFASGSTMKAPGLRFRELTGERTLHRPMNAFVEQLFGQLATVEGIGPSVTEILQRKPPASHANSW